MQILRTLPETRQEQVLELIAAWKAAAEQPALAEATPPAELEWDRGLLVFGGDILVEDPVRFAREQHENDLTRRALGW